MKCRLLFALLSIIPMAAEVRVWQATLTLPTYPEGPPDQNPPFPLFEPSAPVAYPYTLRRNFGATPTKQTWRTLEIENEYLRCTVLPDLGGRIYSCLDKLGKQDLFHANPVIKEFDAAIRGAWVGAGTEFNFPVGHHWSTVSPVDFASRGNADGSASILVGATNRVDGMRWLVEIVLRPGSAAVEQRVTLSNPTPLRHRYYWWNIAGIEAYDDTRFYLPTHLTTDHGEADIQPWPVNRAGKDMSLLANYRNGGVARFAYRCNEGFMGLYSPKEGAGTAHYADPAVLKGKKLWTYGVDPSGLSVLKKIVDDGSQHVELQSGLFTDQETYGFLEPRQVRQFTEYWMPLRGLGGLTRANAAAALFAQRSAGQLSFAVEVYQALPEARLRVVEDDKPLLEETISLTPAKLWTKIIPDSKTGSKYHFELLDAKGQPVLAHTEDFYDAVTAPKPAVSPAPLPGAKEELQGDLPAAALKYTDPLAAGRVLLALNRFDEAVERLAKVPPGAEQRHYLGLAYVYSGDDRKAGVELSASKFDLLFGAPSRLELARIFARSGDRAKALTEVQDALKLRPEMAGAGELEVALLRSLKQTAAAQERLSHYFTLDPANPILRYERVKLGGSDGDLWRHIGADPERVLDAATQYMRAGLYEDALDLLGRTYPDVTPLEAEPGSVRPQDYPLVTYYRAYCKTKLGMAARDELAKASKQSTLYVFPNRPETFAVLRAALKENPADATAHYLLGSLYMAGGSVNPAIQEWRLAVKYHGDFPGLHASLGRALRDFEKDSATAAKVFADGLKSDPRNPIIQDGVKKSLDAKHADEAARTKSGFFVEHNAAPPAGPEELAALALTMLTSGRVADARAVFKEQNFPKEKQSEAVREAFVEVRLRGIVDLAQQKHCSEALAAFETLGDEDPNVPFSMYSFGSILKSARIQYTLANLEAGCGEDKAARKRWAKAAKAGEKAGPVEFAYARLAAIKLNGDAKGTALAAGEAGGSAYAEGLLHRAAGRDREAEAKFQEALKQAGGDIILRYLCQMALLRR